MRKPLFLVICLMLANTGATAQADKQKDYLIERHHGFTVLVNKEAARHAHSLKQFRGALDRQLSRMADVLPEHRFDTLQKHTIWVEWQDANSSGVQYNGSREWLLQNGMNPDKFDAVEIPNMRAFTEDYATAQPYVLLHEFAHAHMNSLPDAARAEIDAAFARALASGKYMSVSRFHGEKEKAYAMTDSWEYFAELSEAYFGENDYFPYTASDLKRFDPDGYALVARLWQ